MAQEINKEYTIRFETHLPSIDKHIPTIMLLCLMVQSNLNCCPREPRSKNSHCDFLMGCLHFEVAFARPVYVPSASILALIIYFFITCDYMVHQWTTIDAATATNNKLPLLVI
ncbi:uncharacterized protein LOC122535739 [Frieseomelitta varia]|uniref:uncharacterized protein LOC122535739 n=1 Tax=Frieseomelitta varia TaxID=561572 RepID=UPI001CB6A852|nr:uncharacterized protein LOC122535739 [Frieseomelitta varia]